MVQRKCVIIELLVLRIALSLLAKFAAYDEIMQMHVIYTFKFPSFLASEDQCDI